MNPTVQTIAALSIVALTAGWMIWRAWSRRGAGDCADHGCAAVSPEARALRRLLRKH